MKRQGVVAAVKKSVGAFAPGGSSRESVDSVILMTTLALLLFGWVVLYSASALLADGRYNDQYFFLKRQLLWSALGLGVLVGAISVKLEFVQKNAYLIMTVTLLLLVGVLVAGKEVGGARRWLSVGGFSFQPSELSKLALVIVLADYLDRRRSRLTDFQKGYLPPLLLMGTLAFLIALEPDLGTPVLLLSVGVGMIFLGGVSLKYLFWTFLAFVPLLWYQIWAYPYRRKRFFSFLNPWEDPQGTGYQLVQSYLALGSGGFWGVGSGESAMKMHYLPEAQTDFIFSVLGEEWGFLGGAVITSLYFVLTYRCFWIASKAPSRFMFLLSAGIGLLLGGQALMNLSVVTGLLPTKGIPLPFLSFGGSSLLLTLASVGLLLNVSRRLKPYGA